MERHWADSVFVWTCILFFLNLPWCVMSGLWSIDLLSNEYTMTTISTWPMMGLLHAAHSPFDSVLTPCRVIFSFRFAISSFSASVSDEDPLVSGCEADVLLCRVTDCTPVETSGADWLEAVEMLVNSASGPDVCHITSTDLYMFGAEIRCGNSE